MKHKTVALHDEVLYVVEVMVDFPAVKSKLYSQMTGDVISTGG